jgi:hypothetical protein
MLHSPRRPRRALLILLLASIASPSRAFSLSPTVSFQAPSPHRPVACRIPSARWGPSFALAGERLAGQGVQLSMAAGEGGSAKTSSATTRRRIGSRPSTTSERDPFSCGDLGPTNPHPKLTHRGIPQTYPTEYVCVAAGGIHLATLMLIGTCSPRVWLRLWGLGFSG